MEHILKYSIEESSSFDAPKPNFVVIKFDNLIKSSLFKNFLTSVSSIL